MGYIVIGNINLQPPQSTVVTVSYKLTSAPDVPGSYTIATTSLQVNFNGSLVGGPYAITGLLDNTSYTVKITVNCDGNSFQKNIVTDEDPAVSTTTTTSTTTTVAPTTTTTSTTTTLTQPTTTSTSTSTSTSSTTTAAPTTTSTSTTGTTSTTTTVDPNCYLVDENSEFILDENGDKIIVDCVTTTTSTTTTDPLTTTTTTTTSTTSSTTTIPVCNDIAVSSFGNIAGAGNTSDDELGFWFTVGPNNLLVTQLGRFRNDGNTGSHAVGLYNSSRVLISQTTVNTSTVGTYEFAYSNLPAAVTLLANTSYLILSDEVNGGDWWSIRPALTTTDITVTSLGSLSGGGETPGAASYGPVNFKYCVEVTPTTTSTSTSSTTTVPLTGTTTSSTTTVPLTTTTSTTTTVFCDTNAISYLSPASGSYNDYTGLIGLQFTVGPNNLLVTRLERFNLAGNTGTHELSLIDLSSNIVLASATVDTNAFPDDTFAWVAIPPTVLSAGGSYFMATAEVNGGDYWQYATPLYPSADIIPASVLSGPVNFKYCVQLPPTTTTTSTSSTTSTSTTTSGTTTVPPQFTTTTTSTTTTLFASCYQIISFNDCYLTDENGDYMVDGDGERIVTPCD